MNQDDRVSPAPSLKSGLSPLRVWPPILFLTVMLITNNMLRFIEQRSPRYFMISVIGPLVGALLIFVWWLFFSKATPRERWFGAGVLMIAAVVSALLLDKSFGVMGIGLYLLPSGFAAFGTAIVLCGRLRSSKRTLIGILAAIVGFGFWDLLRMDGVTGDFAATRHWRWEPTAEETFLASLDNRPSAPPSTVASDVDAPQAFSAPDWPAFRGPHRDGVQPGIVLNEDWQSNPPQELWRIPIGPGWGSFSVAGGRLFTQEQRGDSEVVSCYDAESGAELWTHAYESRFEESAAGAGPRATPTLADGKLYALGAQGILNCLNPLTGDVIWTVDIRKQANRQPPTWGFSASPLLVNNLVVVHAGGADSKGVLAFDAQTGELAWSAPSGDHTYSSAHLAELGGRQQILMVSNTGIDAIDAEDGSLIWQFDDPYDGYRVLQPTVLDNDHLLLSTPLGEGTIKVQVTKTDDQPFTANEIWVSRGIKPSFNDLVVHQGAIYGFDHNIFVCVDLESGQRQWKRGRYGNGQVLLLPAGDQLLVISEEGELILLRANPDKHELLGEFKAMDGKTWNHPVLVGNRLYVRNAQEAVAFEMTIQP